MFPEVNAFSVSLISFPYLHRSAAMKNLIARYYYLTVACALLTVSDSAVVMSTPLSNLSISQFRYPMSIATCPPHDSNTSTAVQNVTRY